MNKFTFIGRLTRDPELRYTRANQPVANFTLALDRNLSREKRQEAQDEGRPTADFIRVQVWGQMAENCNRYLSKGSQCAVSGRVQTGSYQDQETGKTVYTTDFIASNVEFLGGGNTSNNNQGNSQGRNYNSNGANSNSDDFFDDDFVEIEDDGRIPF